MALDNSSNAYERLYGSTGAENEGKYYEGYVEKKEKFKWNQFWCVLKGQNIHFFKDVNTQIKDNYAGYFPLEMPAEAEILKSKEGKYEFLIKTKSRKITLRTHVQSLRQDWIDSMRKAVKGEKPASQSYILPGSGPVSPKTISSPTQASPISSPVRQGSARFRDYMDFSDQIESLEKYSQEIKENAALSDMEISVQDNLLQGDQSWYQSSLCRDDVEKILRGQEKGVFIVRDYIDHRSSQKRGYVISLKDQVGDIRHHRVEEKAERFFIKGYEDKSFTTLENLLRFFIVSQRKRIKLLPFSPSQNPPRNGSDCDTSYETMDTGQSCNRSGRNTARSASFQVRSPVSRYVYQPKGRSKSFHDRVLPPIPSDPCQGAFDIPKRELPPLPTENNNLEKSDRGYIEMQSPMEHRVLPPFPCENGSFSPLSSPLSPAFSTAPTSSSYMNMLAHPVSLSSYENVGQGKIEDFAPPLPPRKRSSSANPEQPYENYPRSNFTGRQLPSRKAHTLERA